jgi:hypothetical protein
MSIALMDNSLEITMIWRLQLNGAVLNEAKHWRGCIFGLNGQAHFVTLQAILLLRIDSMLSDNNATEGESLLMYRRLRCCNFQSFWQNNDVLCF